MTWRIVPPNSKSPSGDEESSEILFDGFENGMGDSAETGIQLIKNANIITATKELMVNFKMTSVTIPPIFTELSASFTGSSDLVTSAGAISAGLYNGCAVYFRDSSGGVTAGNPYWVGNISGNTFKIYDHISRAGSAVNITDASNPISTFPLGPMTQYTLSFATNSGASPAVSPQNFFLDGNGRAWWVNASTSVLVFMGNTTLTDAGGNGLCIIGGNASSAGYLLVFRQTKIDYITLDAISNTSGTLGQWTFGWQTITGYTGVSHQAIEAASYNGVLFCNATTVGTILVNGNSTFDPTSASTYTYNDSALLLPKQDRAVSVIQLGKNFLIGGVQTRIYPWDGTSPAYDPPLIVPEANIQRLVSTNSNAYIFAGNRGRIYVTNGANVDLFRKFPDQVSGLQDPYWVWGGATFWRNQLYFSLTAYTNAGVNSQNAGGVWAIDLDTNALRHTNDTFLGSTASCPVIAPNISSSTPGGSGLYAASTNSSNTAWQLDVGTTTPYTDGSTEIRTEIVPVGTFYVNRSFKQVEYKLSRPLVAGESIEIKWRPNLQSAFTALTSDSTQLGAMSGVFVSNIDPSQYIQLQALLTSTASSPSYCRLTEMRLR